MIPLSCVSVPIFALGYFLIWVFAVRLDLLPVQGYTPISQGFRPFLVSLTLPSLALGIVYVALIARMTRATMIEVLNQDYIRTAKAKGLWQSLVLRRHALKNAMLPVMTVIGVEFAFLIGGLVVTEQVFNLNGLGLLFVQAVAHRDYTLLQALVMLVAGIFIFMNFLLDAAFAWLDPRVRYA